MLARAARSLVRPSSLVAGSGASLAGFLAGSQQDGGLRGARCAAAAAGPSNPFPPPDAARGATADLTDVFCPDPVDTVTAGSVQIMEAGLFRWGGVCVWQGGGA
jgi:hypothetical protein